MKMAMERGKRHPSFFKKLLGDFTHKLKIPPAFLKNFQGNVPKKLLVNCGGQSWFIRTEESDEGYHFSQGLAKFVKDLHLELGDLVIFSMVGHETFEVVVCDTTCCEKTTISTRCNGRQPCAHAEGKSSRFNEVKKEEEESVERSTPTRHPYFVRSMRKYEMRWLNLPAAFAREAGLKSKRSVVIEDPLRRMWPVQLRHYVNHTSISGWSYVVKANGFTVGDTLMFEYLRGRGDAIALRVMSRAGRDGAGPAYEKRALKSELMLFSRKGRNNFCSFRREREMFWRVFDVDEVIGARTVCRSCGLRLFGPLIVCSDGHPCASSLGDTVLAWCMQMIWIDWCDHF